MSLTAGLKPFDLDAASASFGLVPVSDRLSLMATRKPSVPPTAVSFQIKVQQEVSSQSSQQSSWESETQARALPSAGYGPQAWSLRVETSSSLAQALRFRCGPGPAESLSLNEFIRNVNSGTPPRPTELGPLGAGIAICVLAGPPSASNSV